MAPKRQSLHHQHGISLIESLVSLLVLALGVLGMLGVQLKSMADNQNATQRVLAARLADDLFERIKANPSGVGGLATYSVNSSWANIASPAANQLCDANACNAAQQAAYDLWAWQRSVRNTLPGGNATTFISPSDAEQLGVMISWQLRQTDTSSVAGADAVRAGWLNVDVANGAACPAGSVCLLAYAKP